MVNTVLGSIPASEMGATLCHEHCFIEADFWAENPDNIEPRFRGLIDEPLTIANMSLVTRAGSFSKDNQIIVEPFHVLKELRAYHEAGGMTVVDCTVDGIGRERHYFRLPQLSKLSCVNIIAPTGYYVNISHPLKVKHQSAEDIAQDFIRDITEGIHGTNMKAGVIGEVGVSPGEFKEQEKKVVQASAIAQKETRMPLTVHTWGDPPGKWTGFEVIDFLQKCDADLEKVYMSHIDWTVAQ
jgi:phosphotriesterase-related protein